MLIVQGMKQDKNIHGISVYYFLNHFAVRPFCIEAMPHLARGVGEASLRDQIVTG